MRVAYFSLRLFLLSKCSILIMNYKKRRGGGRVERGRERERETGSKGGKKTKE